MEEIVRYDSIEQARNAAVLWMEEQGGGPIGPYYEVELGRLGAGEGAEVGVSSTQGTYRRVRLDFDPIKGCHYNVEVGKGTGRRKRAFCFPGDETWISKIFSGRGPR
jgi:hypothetical protein